ncbi:MAG: aldehyde dehydrogenase family protein, partial [Acidobacteriota bacterium]
MTAPVLIGGSWRDAQQPTGTFTALEPSTGNALPDAYPISSVADVETACAAGAQASIEGRRLPDLTDRIAAFLDGYADRIEAAAEPLCEMASRETGYPVTPRLKAVELPRTTNQLRQGAAAARDRGWSHATIDTKTNIRSRFEALGGPVVVFGPNNFPFAFNSVAGGDFVAAVAAGNPVIGKANTSHPGTSRFLAELAFEAVKAAGLPQAWVQMIYRTKPEVGFRLVSDPRVAATGFTGSKSAGLQLKAAAEKAGKPIYLEMSSVNPIFVLPGALRERGATIAKELFDSCALGAGQFCTRPGLTLVQDSPEAQAFVNDAQGHFAAATPGTLLGIAGREAIGQALKVLTAHGAEILAGGQPIEGGRVSFASTLLRVTGDKFLADPEALQTEAFGTVNMVVVVKDAAQMTGIATAIDGNLTGSIYSDTGGSDDGYYGELAPVLRQKVGRLLNDKMPTGVAVSPAMNHGGPYPATGHPGFTAVGIPASLLRFAALCSYDNVRAHRLPAELQDKNPTGTMQRFIDGA